MPHRPAVPKDIKNRLKKEAGNKCANPGCSTNSIEYHHIKHWAVYQTHDEQHMIVLCPTCHAAAHGGKLKIEDAEIYAWKKLSPVITSKTAHLYVKPAPYPSIQMGNIHFRFVKSEFYMIHLTDDAFIKVRIVKGKYLTITTQIKNISGEIVISVDENNVEENNSKLINFYDRAGHVLITTEKPLEFIPEWLYEKIKDREPWCNEKEFPLISMKVLEHGLIQLITYIYGDGKFCISGNDFVGLGWFRDEDFVTLATYGEGTSPILTLDSSTLLLDELLKNIKPKPETII